MCNFAKNIRIATIFANSYPSDMGTGRYNMKYPEELSL